MIALPVGRIFLQVVFVSLNMGKSKKITEKVKLFYRGPANKPNKFATEDDMRTIISAFKVCLPQRTRIFATNWRSERASLKLVVGLSASLRALKSKRTKAIIYDDTAANHLAKYFNEFARLQRLPIIQARGLMEKASEFNLTSLLVVSITSAGSAPEDPAAVPIESSEFDKLCTLLVETYDSYKPKEDIEFKLPVLEKVPSSGNSRAKKQARKAAALQQQTHVRKTKRNQPGKKARQRRKRLINQS